MAVRRITVGRTGWVRVGIGVAVAGAVGLGLLAAPAGAGAAPELPPVAADDLVASVLAAHPGPFGGTVELDNKLGLPPLPQLPQLADRTSTARIWSDGDGKGRLSVPIEGGVVPADQSERTIVADGTTVWSWNSADHSVTRRPEGVPGHEVPEAAATDPAAAATTALTLLRASSTVRVDGTAEVAGRPAYELVLAPAPTERTLLREVRIAVDAQLRVPLRLTVLSNGSADPALQLGFTDLTFGAQDPALFTFTPPPGATVTDAAPPDPLAPTAPAPGAEPTAPTPPAVGAKPTVPMEAAPGAEPTVVGDGWDTVVIATAPTAGAPELSRLGTPVSGPWGSGREISTSVATAILTDDGRIAAGAVPVQLLAEALSR